VNNIAIIGFEYDITVPAFSQVLQRLSKEGNHLSPVIWSARDGIRKNVLNYFPKCEFLDHAEGWHGLCDRVPASEVEAMRSISEIEIKHFSYTHSRITFFRDPGRWTDKDILFYQHIFNVSCALLKKHNVSLMFFVKIPHTLLDLGLYFAAQRLGVKFLYTDGPFFGDYVFPNIDKTAKFSIGSFPLGDDAQAKFKLAMRKRNLSYNLEPPAYTKKETLDYLPKTPESNLPFFTYKIIRNIYGRTKNMFVCKVLERLLYVNARFFSACSKALVRLMYVKKKIKVSNNKYILVLLQYHPEQTTSASAKDTPFEEERVALIAKQFPDTNIVVREHPTNLKSGNFVQYRSFRALRRMMKNTNVQYMFPGERSEYREILQNALCTIATSGTVAFESIQLGVPCIHFSDSFAQGYPGVLCAEKVTDISNEKLSEMREELSNLSNEELVLKCSEAMTVRPMKKGFLTGYHEDKYSQDQFIESATEIIYTALSYKLNAIEIDDENKKQRG
jgi:hypothetical protein